MLLQQYQWLPWFIWLFGLLHTGDGLRLKGESEACDLSKQVLMSQSRQLEAVVVVVQLLSIQEFFSGLLAATLGLRSLVYSTAVIQTFQA